MNFRYGLKNYLDYIINMMPVIALAIKASGMGSISTTVLLEPEEIDKATSLVVKYRHPGT